MTLAEAATPLTTVPPLIVPKVRTTPPTAGSKLRAIIAWICSTKLATETIGSTARCGMPAWPATPVNSTVTLLLPASRVPGRVAMTPASNSGDTCSA